MAQYASSGQPVRYFIISFPLGKDTVEYFSHEVTSKDLHITFIKRGNVSYPFDVWHSTAWETEEIKYTWEISGTKLSALPSLTDEQIQAMMTLHDGAYSDYRLTIPHQ